ncbi:MAG: hypothetical protein WBM13_03900 [Bacteroidia bacterium]
MNNIAIIGAGQLGSRHLQGLTTIQMPAKIYVVEPNMASLKLAEERYKEMEVNPLITELKLLATIDELPETLDLVIVATNANIRSSVTKSIIAKCQVRNFVFEKVLFQKEEDYLEIAELLKQRNIKAWVNCTRRLFNDYRLLKELFSKNQSIFFSVIGGDWGLGCNGIHFIDFLAFITEDYDIELSAEFLSPVLLESKRKGFKEFTGTLMGKQKNGSTIILNSEPFYSGNMLMTIRGNHTIVIVDEAKGKMNIAMEHTGWKWEEKNIGIEYQSQLTGAIADEIVITGRCGLTKFEDSVKLHTPFIRVFLNFYNSISSEKLEVCPIT